VEVDSDKFLKSKQQGMKDWFGLLQERSTRHGKPIKPQVIAAAVSEQLDHDAIISVDCGTDTSWAAQHIMIKEGMKFSLSGTLASMACGLPYAIAAQAASASHLLEMEASRCLWVNLRQPSNTNFPSRSS